MFKVYNHLNKLSRLFYSDFLKQTFIDNTIIPLYTLSIKLFHFDIQTNFSFKDFLYLSAFNLITAFPHSFLLRELFCFKIFKNNEVQNDIYIKFKRINP